ncbi:Major facilitator superfamily domain general substrate transporter [Penicillium chermesinum]|uniref:Major facilitator superfamily domain general substrate transporter n=1 Tax=Penicillium chermesinum TaxID=63820 RepID=A0A9W9TA61_9EURO|nr:Major facilitator superfamily domain general substrate transporter [Penicillium chermesinum]KAJ5215031.1 Major facilitator superfamily domain general substrate transporter [Penicillium chermesinum]
MGLGVLEDRKLELVPGRTSHIYEVTRSSSSQPSEVTGLKHAKNARIPTILVPQSSKDPHDPSNWPLWRRDLILSILCFITVLCIITVLCTTIGSIMAANTVTTADYNHITFVDAALLTGFHLCGTGVTGIFIVPTANMGKAHLFILGHGIALAPFEALVNACVDDLYFVHERGKRMAITNVALFGAACYRGQEHQVSWLAMVILLCGHFSSCSAALHDKLDQSKSAFPDDFTSTTEVPAAATQENESFLKSFRLCNGRETDDPFFKLVVRSFPLLFHLGILYACLIQSVMIGWSVFIGVSLATVFLGPPTWFPEEETGYLYAGAFAGAMVGFVLSAVLTDSMNKIMIRLNRGIYEPEFRIPIVILQLIFSSIGLYGFGWTANDVAKYSWLLPDVFFAFVIAGVVVGAVAAPLYIIDAHGK